MESQPENVSRIVRRQAELWSICYIVPNVCVSLLQQRWAPPPHAFAAREFDPCSLQTEILGRAALVFEHRYFHSSLTAVPKSRGD